MTSTTQTPSPGRLQPARDFLATPPAQLTAQMEQDFFSSLMASNRTYKTTFRQRFADTNPTLIEHVRAGAGTAMQVLDIGISYGVSTAELFDDLQAAGIDASIVATDVLTDACLVKAGPGCHVLLDHEGFPLRFDLPGGTMRPWVIPDDYRSGRFVLRKGVNKVLTWRARRIMARGDAHRIKPVKLVTPRLLANAAVTVRTDDITCFNAGFARRFNLVRAANVLNTGYFSAQDLAIMVDHVRSYLRAAGGYLFVVRTHQDNSNHGSLFRLGDNQQFDVVWRVGDGSEIENIVLALEAAHG